MLAPRPLVLALALTLLAAAPQADAQRGGAKAPAVPVACADFYGHVNADWLMANPLPPGESEFGQFDQLNALALAQQRQILDQALKAPKDEHQRALGEFWASALDEAAIERLGAEPLQPALDAIAKAKRSRELAGIVASLHSRGLPVLFNFTSDLDLRDLDRTIGYATQGGLGLPDPAYYTRSDEDTRALLGRYRAHVEKLLGLTGTPQAQRQTESAWVVGIEMRLARASIGLVQLRDPANAYQPTPVKELDKTYKRLKLGEFLRTQGVTAGSISLAHTGFFAEADKLLGSLPIEQWKAYLRFHVANAAAPYLSKPFRDADFDLYGSVLRGKQQPDPREVDILRTMNVAVGELLGLEYVEQFLTAQEATRAETIASGVKAALERAVQDAPWLGTPTRQQALTKLAALRIEIGRQQETLDLSDLKIGRGTYAANVISAAVWRHRREMALIGTRGHGRRWPSLPQVPDVAYSLAENRLVVTAAMLQPPVFDANADSAGNYGALGALIGDELSHSVLDKGRLIDAERNLRDWWDPADAAAFQQRVAPLIAQYSGYSVDGGLKVDGRQTLAANIADLAGLELAWDAWTRTHPKPAKDAVQRFFEGWAKVWPHHYTTEALRLRLATDVHAPAQWRVNGPLANMTPFGETYCCRIGAVMRNPEAQRVSIWH